MRRHIPVLQVVLLVSLITAGCVASAPIEVPPAPTELLAEAPTSDPTEKPSEEEWICDDLLGNYPSLAPNKAEERAQGLIRVIRSRGIPLDYAQVPTLEQMLRLLNTSAEGLEDFAEPYLCTEIALAELIISACAHQSDPSLVLDLGGVLVFDVDGDGELAGGGDGIFFTLEDENLWFPTREEDRLERPEMGEFADWLYPNIILGTAEGFDPGPDVEMVGFLGNLFWGAVDFFEETITPEWKLKEQWGKLVPTLKGYGLPTKMVEDAYGKTLLRSIAKTGTPHYIAGLDTMYMPKGFFDPEWPTLLRDDLDAQDISQVYHEFVHAFWDRVGEQDKNHAMYKLVHGIANELKDKELRVGNAGDKKLKLSKNEALWYAEEAVAYAVQALVKFHAEYYTNEKYFKGGKLTTEGRKLILSGGWLGKERKSGYFKRSSTRYWLYDRGLTDYSLNKAFEVMRAGFRIDNAEAKKATYTKTVK